jgi:hypothetical protein
VFKRAKALLYKYFPLPLAKGKGIKGIGFKGGLTIIWLSSKLVLAAKLRRLCLA